MGWIEPHGNGFRGRVQVGGERLSTETASTRKRAKELLRDLERQLTDPQWQDPRRGDVLFSVWVEEWRKTRGTLEEKTTTTDEGRLRNHVLPAFEDEMLSEINALRVRQWVSDLSARMAPGTVRHCHALLHGILQLAVDTERIRRNPCKGTPLPEVPRKDQVILEVDELDVFIDCFDNDNARALVMTLAGTGLRWGEGVGVRAGRVNLQRKRLMVRDVLSETNGVLRFKELPKRRASYRMVALPDSVVDALRPLVAGKDDDDLVFTSVDCAGTCRHCRAARDKAVAAKMPARQLRDRIRLVHAFRNQAFRRAHWDPALAAAEVRGLKLKPTPHDLRHTHASMLIDANVPPMDIQRRLGHASIAITMDVYGHLFRHSDARILDVLNKRMPANRGQTLDDALADMLSGHPPKDGGGTVGGRTDDN